MSDDSIDQGIVLFGENAAGVYMFSNIYDPDIDGSDPTLASGKIVPAVGSQVVKITTTASSAIRCQLYTVTAINPTTYKVTLEPTSLVSTEESNYDRVLSYGNDIFMLYFAPTTVTVLGQDISLTKLIVDNKFSMFGNHSAKYQLTRTTQSGVIEIISLTYSTSGSLTSTMIDMVETTSAYPGVRRCNGCFTMHDLVDGELITCNIYDAAGLLIGAVTLVTKQAHYLNDASEAANPIVTFTVDGNQFDPADGKLFLYKGQNKEELVIYPTLTYANNGMSQIVPIDGISGFVYGLEDLDTSIPGMEFPLTIKYYVNEDVVSDLLEVVGDVAFLSTTITVKIVSQDIYTLNKVSIAPIWDAGSSRYTLSLRGYKINRADVNGPSTGNFATVTGFSGTTLNSAQTITILATTQAENGSIAEFEQQVVIELRNPTGVPAGGIRWLIRDPSTPVGDSYGDNTGEHIRPTIRYNSTFENYEIPTTGNSNIAVTANSNQTALEVLIENFYTKASPPTVDGESVAPTPTHFRIINPMTGQSISPTYRDITQWSGNLLLTHETALPRQYVGNTLVMEFLLSNGAGSYSYLYSAPVDVVDE